MDIQAKQNDGDARISVVKLRKTKNSGLLLVNLGFWIFRFSDFRFSRFFVFAKCFRTMLVRYRGINNKGVLERPWTKWRVLRAISTTLKCQFTVNCWKVDFPTPCKTKSCQSSTESLRMAPRTPLDLLNFNLNYEKNSFCETLDFSRFTNRSVVLFLLNF